MQLSYLLDQEDQEEGAKINLQGHMYSTFSAKMRPDCGLQWFSLLSPSSLSSFIFFFLPTLFRLCFYRIHTLLLATEPEVSITTGPCCLFHIFHIIS